MKDIDYFDAKERKLYLKKKNRQSHELALKS